MALGAGFGLPVGVVGLERERGMCKGSMLAERPRFGEAGLRRMCRQRCRERGLTARGWG